MRKFLALVILVPLTVVLVMFAVANRHIVTVSFDPFSSVDPAFAMKAPLFIMIFIMVGVGVLVGGAAAWLRQRKWRMRARRAEAEVRELRATIEAPPARGGVPAPVEVPPFAVPPAA